MSGDANEPVTRLALLTDFTPNFLAGEIRQAARRENMPIDILTVNPATRAAEILNPASDLRAFQPDVLLLGLSGPVQWAHFQERHAGTERIQFGKRLLEQCQHDWENLQTRFPGAEIWQTNLGSFPDGISGTGAVRDPKTFAYQRAQFNHALIKSMVSHRYVNLIDWDVEIQVAGNLHAYDTRLWLTAAHPFSLDFLPNLAEPLVNRLKWRAGRFLKVLVVDLDNTLWGGVVGEDGPHDIQISQEGMGNVFRCFQLWLRHLKEEGVLLAVASKNDDVKAREPFTINPEMILGLEDFAVFKTGWNPKSEMIQAISNEVNIGLDAFAFIDDSAFERTEVLSQLPQVTVPEMPDDPSLWIPFLAECHLFESGPHSAADEQRTRWVQDEQERRTQQATYSTYEDYLKSLQMRGRVAPLEEAQLARAHQLVMRTNQFNLRTMRHSLDTMEGMLASPDWTGRLFGLADRLGDYGWVSLVLLHLDPDGKSAFLDTWVTSCRVFERGMERFILNQLVAELQTIGFTRLIGEFRPSPKNGKFAGLLTDLGFNPTGDNRWRLDLGTTPVHETHITLE